MPNPQVHAAVGMIGSLVLLSIVYPLVRKYYPEKIKKVLLFLPLIILLVPELIVRI